MSETAVPPKPTPAATPGKDPANVPRQGDFPWPKGPPRSPETPRQARSYGR